jgi:universal stress protein A
MIVSLRRILFPTDFSDPAKEAQQYACTLAEKFDAQLHALHIVHDPFHSIPAARVSWAVPEHDDLKQHVESARLHLLRELGDEWTDRRRAVCSVKLGLPAEEILNYVDQHEIDLIVIGTHGRRGLSHMLLGSVAEKLVRIATCPVLTVHPKGHQFLI